MAIYQLDDEHPELPADHRYWVAESASVIGRVRLKTDASIWFGSVLRGEAALTALLEREVSGEGQWVKTSLLQAQIFMLDFQAARWLMEKDVAKQAGNNHPTSIPQDLRRLHQYRHHGGTHLGALRAGDRRARACDQP